MKLTACLIVKNEESVLAKTMPALKAGVDEIIVVDTGSSDRTAEVAASFGARVSHFAWCDDFSAARNESLKQATGDWIVWIDADEFISPEAWQALRGALEQSAENAYYLPIYDCNFGEAEGSNFYFRLKVFRNNLGIHFERPFNEQVHDAAGRLLEPTAFLPQVRIAHWGGKGLGPDQQGRKKERNLRLLKDLVEKQPQDPYYHFLLANNYVDVGNKDQAVLEYDRVAAITGANPLIGQARVKKAKLLIDRGENDAAYAELKEVVSREPGNAEAYNLIGTIYLYIGNLEKAVQVLTYAATLTAPRNAVMGCDLLQYTYFPHFLLGNAYLLLGQKAKALAELRAAYQFQANPGLQANIEKLEKEVG